MEYKRKPRFLGLIVAVTLLGSCLFLISCIALLYLHPFQGYQQRQEAFAENMSSMGAMESMGYTNYSSSNFIIYQNVAMNIKIEYPAVWKIAEHNSANNKLLEFIAPPESHMDLFPPVVTISVRNLTSNNVTLAMYTKENLDDAKRSLPSFQLVESNDTTLDGLKAHRIVYTFVSSNPSAQIHFQTMNIWTIKDDRVYTFTYSDSRLEYTRHIPIIQKMIDSFKVI
jgi:hypothetical protein